MNTIDIDQLLRDAGPRVTTPPSTGLMVGSIAREIAAEKSAHSIRAGVRRSRVIVAGGIAAICMAGTGVAAAAVIGAHTGWFGSSGMTEEDTSEFIDTGAADFPTVAASLVPSDLPLPSGITVEDATAQIVRQDIANPGLQQTTGIKATYVFYAQCQWKRVALNGAVPASDAAAELTTLANSPTFVAIDGGGLRDSELRIAQAAEVGDLTPMNADFAANCKDGLGDAPEIER